MTPPERPGETSVEDLLRFQDGVQALLGVLNDIRGGGPWKYNVVPEAAEAALCAALTAMASKPHRDAVLDRLNFAVSDYVARRHGIISSGPGNDTMRRMLAHALIGTPEGEDWLTGATHAA